MNANCKTGQYDYGPGPYTLNVECAASQNRNFRTAVWTGCHLQMTLMCIPPCGEIGLEIHQDTEQMIRIEQGCAQVRMGKCKNKLDYVQSIGKGECVFVPAGIWHNIINTGRNDLKVSSVYAPPHHSKGTVHPTKKDAEMKQSWD